MLKIIKETNFDIFGVIFFIILIFYFISLPQYTILTNTLLFGSIIGFIIDSRTVYKYIKSNDNK